MSLRIAGGSARGRPLQVPPAGTRPTSERARSGLFNRLATLVDLDGAAVLDLYAGSGAVGLEAISRGAAVAVLVDSDRRAAQVIRANAGLLAGRAGTAGEAGQVHVRPVKVAAFLSTDTADVPGAPFDAVFADPPYDVDDAAVASMLQALARTDWTAAGAVVVVERSIRSAEPRWPERFQPLAGRKYGEAMLWYGQAQ